MPAGNAPETGATAGYGSAKHPERPVVHPRPAGAGDAEVAATGKLSEALEAVEEARGLLYGFHRRSGTADRLLQEAVTELRVAGATALADQVEQVLVGRDVVPGCWTFQLVEAYDTQYWSVFRAVAEQVRAELTGGRPHVFEAEMKQREQAGADPSRSSRQRADRGFGMPRTPQ
jgi:hypothetical protein